MESSQEQVIGRTTLDSVGLDEDRMLAEMFGTAGDGLSDRLLHFVTPVGGGYFFVPRKPCCSASPVEAAAA